MKVALTGATGFLGRHVQAALCARGLDVTAMVRPGPKAPVLSTGVQPASMDMDDAGPDTFERLGRPDVLVHLAWGGLPNYAATTHLDVELPRQLRFLEACVKGGLKNLIVTGTCLEYGMREGELHEGMPALPTTAYAIAKHRLHEHVDGWRVERGLALAWLRVFYLYGPGQAPSSLYSQLNAAIDRGDARFPMSAGDQVRDFMPVEKAATAIAALARLNADPGTVNLCSGEPTRVLDIAQRWVHARGASIVLDTGHFPYPAYEPFSFWGNRSKVNSLLYSGPIPSDP